MKIDLWALHRPTFIQSKAYMQVIVSVIWLQTEERVWYYIDITLSLLWSVLLFYFSRMIASLPP